MPDRVRLGDHGQLTAALTDRLHDRPEWLARVTQLAGDPPPRGLHLAVFREPFLDLILCGRKTVESRFSRNHVAPHGRLVEGDLLLLKRQSGPVAGIAEVGAANYYRLDPDTFTQIRATFASRLCAEAREFWEARSAARHATLAHIRQAAVVDPFWVDKRDRRAWVVLQSSAATQPHSVEQAA